ncbi:fimbrial biogenesis chaperone [Streptomyces sp. NP10]|uniref:fimbrial biogenesis chaperone n=1 Tax=Streptomyces sp. NP10 TaxID=1141731 RepID=UPI000F892CBB|nr:fimbria/pilus periplasmic chaperone [Streptomyces sp. NP10]
MSIVEGTSRESSVSRPERAPHMSIGINHAHIFMGRESAAVRVSSKSTTPTYVHVSLHETGGKGEHPVQPDAQVSLAVTPGKFELAGGASRLVKLIPLDRSKEPGTERRFRLIFEEVAGPDGSQPQDRGVTWACVVSYRPENLSGDPDAPLESVVSADPPHLTLRNPSPCFAGVEEFRVNGKAVEDFEHRTITPGGEISCEATVEAGASLTWRYRTSEGREHTGTATA